jgi:hypothetical protein
MMSRLVCVWTLFICCSTASAQWERLRSDSTISCLYTDSHVLYLGRWDAPHVLASSDSGWHWGTAVNALPRTWNGLVPIVYALQIHGNRLFIGTDDSMYFLDHDGVTLAADHPSLAFCERSSDLFCGSNSGVLHEQSESDWHYDTIPWWSASGAFAMYATSAYTLAGGYGFGIAKSTNEGTTWTDVSTTMSDYYVWSFAEWNGALYAGTTTRIFRSTTDGDTWQEVPISVPSAYYRLKAAGKYLMAISSNGFFFTSDGQHWRDATAGLPDSTMLTSWLHIESLDDHVYISVAPGSGTSGGLWRRPLSDFDRLEVSDRAQPAFRIEAYPNPFGDATTLRVTTDRAQPLHVAWSNVFGEEIASKDIPANANTQNILFDAKDKPSGVSFCRLISPEFSKVLSVIKK